MVSALYQSRLSKGGTRQFTCGDKTFGWEVIVDMYKRETERRKTGQCVRVPKLKANHVYRDAWTRLNVLPSKVMQVYVFIVKCIMSSVLHNDNYTYN